MAAEGFNKIGKIGIHNKLKKNKKQFHRSYLPLEDLHSFGYQLFHLSQFAVNLTLKKNQYK